VPAARRSNLAGQLFSSGAGTTSPVEGEAGLGKRGLHLDGRWRLGQRRRGEGHAGGGGDSALDWGENGRRIGRRGRRRGSGCRRLPRRRAAPGRGLGAGTGHDGNARPPHGELRDMRRVTASPVSQRPCRLVPQRRKVVPGAVWRTAGVARVSCETTARGSWPPATTSPPATTAVFTAP